MLLHATARPEKEWPVASMDRARPGACGARATRWCCRGATTPSGSAACGSPPRCRTREVPDLRPLDDVARMIAARRFVVGVDTGLLHLAAALGVPLVAIFVGSEPGLHGPMGAGPIAVVGGRGDRCPAVDDVRAADRRGSALTVTSRLRERALRHRAEHLLGGDVAHAEVMAHPAGRLVAGPAGERRRGLTTAASGLSGAQCHGLVGPKMPTAGVPERGGDMQQARNCSTPRRRRPRAPGWRCAGRCR